MNQEVVKVILDYKCLKRARDNQLLIIVALQQFEEETGLGKKRYTRTLQELKNFKAAVAAVLICSVVAAAIATPDVAAALAAVTATPIGSMGKWIDSLLNNYENAMKEPKEVTFSMQVGTYVAIKDMENIWVLVDRLEVEIESLLHNVEFAIEEAVKVAIEEIQKKLGSFYEEC
ncbi:hypothetical protein JHK87_020134 [Glycine soja]|nr:hypothetical protein JHK87_020134 [Glycine soja]